MNRSNNIFWCQKCNTPLLQRQCENCGDRGVRICSDLKPMFADECRLLEQKIKRQLPGKSWQNGLWMRRNTVRYRGKKFLRISMDGKPTLGKNYSIDRESSGEECFVSSKTIYKANRSSLGRLEQEAISFIRKTVRSYSKRKPVVSFSGGKDSSVVSYLVRKALKSRNVTHIFGNTTIEYPDTLNFIKYFSEKNKGIPFFEPSNSHSFFEMCKLVGPPSRLNAWCCSVFKATPLATILNKINREDGVLSFEGIRRKESSRRRNRKTIYLNKKIARSISAYPILDWKEIEVWLYILVKGLDFNDAYKKGFNRVGCMYCPNNTSYNEYLIKTYYPKKSHKWINFLLAYARRIGKENPSDYVLSGAWKARIGKSDKRNLPYVRKAPCLKNMNAMHFILEKKITNDFVERFKPFGKIKIFSDPTGKGFIIENVESNESLFMIKKVENIDILKKESKINPHWDLKGEFLCVDILTNKSIHRLLCGIERQIKKFQICVLCGACAGICPTNAININPHFRINEKKCIHCGRCISTKFLRDSCISLHASQQTSKYRIAH